MESSTLACLFSHCNLIRVKLKRPAINQFRLAKVAEGMKAEA